VFDRVTLKLILNKAMNQYLGITGEGINVDILQIQAKKAVLRVPADKLQLTWSALSGYNDPTSAITVIKTSMYLMALTNDREKW
jgi:hypothetical protein